jgi:aspartate aminotransferase
MIATTTKADQLAASVAPFLAFFNGPIWARNSEPGMANFAVGNPTEMPLPAYVDALRAHLEPQSPDWFAYKLSEPKSQAIVARSLSERT